MDEKQLLVLKGKWCPYCDRETVLKDAKVIYGVDGYGSAYVCEQCFAYCGCHQGSTKSLGSVANNSLRKLRNQTHAIYDPIWKHMVQTTNYTKLEARTACYIWLSVLMRIDIRYCHIGMFTEEQCLDAIYLITRFNPFKDEINQR